jgi:hypothetical protein
MDPRLNPYSPGAGSQPPELAGRDPVIRKAEIALDRIRKGRGAQSLVLYGLRGVGKTVLLNRIRTDAEARGLESVKIEAPEDRSLPAILIPALRVTLLRIDRMAAAKDAVGKALGALRSFIGSVKIKYQDVEAGLDVPVARGVADSGDLESDLIELFSGIGLAAKAGDTAIVLYIDELQYIKETELAILIRALHAISQLNLPLTMVAAGLPQLLGMMGRAKSYAERLFVFEEIDELSREAAARALKLPAEKEGVLYDNDAIESIIDRTEAYPYFLQEWGKHAWNLADDSPITIDDADAASEAAIDELDASFFRVRFDRLTPIEKRYVRAMAEIRLGPFRSGEIAAKLGRTVNSVAPVRSSLIRKGMIYAPAHGDTAFTVPMFDSFLRRTMPFEP